MEGKAHVISFLKNCIEYAEASIERKKGRGELDDIPKWEAYRDYTAHALMEVQAGELDRWFENQSKPLNNNNLATVELDTLSHQARASLLTNLASPRPLALVSTSSQEGVRNIAPYTSLSVVTNTPPMAVVSLSANRNDRLRDTLLNLRQTKKAVLNFLPASDAAGLMVQQTAQPLDRDQSEWDEFELDGLEVDPLVLKNAAFAIVGQMVDEMDLPDSNTKLVVLKLDQILVPEEYDTNQPSHILCQHGLNRLMSTPSAWHYNIDRNV